MNWFTNVRTVEELRKQYRQLMKKHHERLFAILIRQERPQGEQEYKDTAEDRAIRAVLDALAGIDADVEIIGSWVWVTRKSSCRDDEQKDT